MLSSQMPLSIRPTLEAHFRGQKAMSNGVDRRAQMDIETSKGLLLINGGGAVALLSVFSALVGKEGFEPLLSAVLLSVFGMMGGLVCAIFHNYFRRKCSLHYELHKMAPPGGSFFGVPLPEPGVCFVGTLFLCVSVTCFMSAGSYVAYTGLTNMEQLQRGGKSKATQQAAPEVKKQAAPELKKSADQKTKK